MTPLALEPPAEEPVSLAEAREFLRLDQTAEDDLLAMLLTAARLMVEAGCGRCLVDQHWRIALDRWPQAAEILLPLSPVSAVLAARVYDARGQALPVAPGALLLDPGADPPLIRIAGAVPQPGRAHAGIEIDVVAGFGPKAADVPAPLRQAVLRLAARWFEERGDIASRDAQALPASIAGLLAPYRRARL